MEQGNEGLGLHWGTEGPETLTWKGGGQRGSSPSLFLQGSCISVLPASEFLHAAVLTAWAPGKGLLDALTLTLELLLLEPQE